MSKKITLEDLKNHCIRTIEACEQFRKLPNVVVTDDRRYQEHKMVLQLIEEHEQRQSTDAVSREEALKEMQKYYDDCAKTSEYTRLGFETAMNVIKDLQPVTPERPKGEWIGHFNETFETHWNTCSLCGQETTIAWNFCPNCGTDMREVSECSEENKN